jgi:hypothetical protein
MIFWRQLMKSFYLVLIGILLVFLNSCASLGPRYSEADSMHSGMPPGKARLYFLREAKFLYSARAAPIEVDEKQVGKLGNGGFLFVDTAPGTHTISTKTWDAGRFSIEMTVSENTAYYLLVGPRAEMLAFIPFGLVGSLIIENNGLFSIVPIDEESGMKKLQGLRSSM